MVRTRNTDVILEDSPHEIVSMRPNRIRRKPGYLQHDEDDVSDESGYAIDTRCRSRRDLQDFASYSTRRSSRILKSRENRLRSDGFRRITRNSVKVEESEEVFDGEAEPAEEEDEEDGGDEEEDEIDPEDEEEQGDEQSEHNELIVNGIRRSTRRRKSTYDTLNQSWILNTKLPEFSSSLENNQTRLSRKRQRSGGNSEEFEDMYTRVKSQKRGRGRPPLYNNKSAKQDGIEDSADDGDTEEAANDENEVGNDDVRTNHQWESNDETSPEEVAATGQRKQTYYLRQKKPTVNRFQAHAEPVPRITRSSKNVFHLSPPRRQVERFKVLRSPAHKSPLVSRRRQPRHHATHNSSTSSSSASESSSQDEGNVEERRFERRKAKSMARSRNRCLPMNLTADDLTKLTHNVRADRMKVGTSLADVDPMNIDKSVTFDSIGGLQKHIESLKEMIIFPFLYPEVFEKFKITPPRGVLFYGPPGTGKTLVARALANECSKGDKKVAFFMRKGADCLSKWVGESERQLRLLFDQAYTMRPSIIFFDEIDGLAPVRSSRQDQIHSSIVSTLLALMDGLDSRGEVVVIGATNRIDAIDPALRRPGRFDREFMFALPALKDRKSILKIHTSSWNPPLSNSLVDELANRTVGYCGADLKALTAEAALMSLKRKYPQIYRSDKKLQLDVSKIKVKPRDFMAATLSIVPASQRSVTSPGRALPDAIRPCLQNMLNSILDILKSIFPEGMKKIKGNLPALPGTSSSSTMITTSDMLMTSETEDDSDDSSSSASSNPTSPLASPIITALPVTPNCLSNKRLSNAQRRLFRSKSMMTHQSSSHRPRLVITGEPDQGQSSYLAPAVLHTLEHLPVNKLDLPALYAVTAKAPEESCAQVFHEACRRLPGILYLSHIDQWWDTLSDTVRATFLSLLYDLEPSAPLLVLATSDCPFDELPDQVKQLFSRRQGEVVAMRNPNADERREFFKDLLFSETMIPPKAKTAEVRELTELPLAPLPEPRKLTDNELKRLEGQEESTLRELRLFLREVLYKLARDRRFTIFTKPVDTSEITDYLDVIKAPMDLETMLTRIDTHHYETVSQFLADVELICHNALEYNPDRNPTDKMIRHRACALRDAAHAVIDSELDPDFEKTCQDISEARKRRGFVHQKFAPRNYHVVPRKLPQPSMADGSNSDPTAATMNGDLVSPDASGKRCSRRIRGLTATEDEHEPAGMSDSKVNMNSSQNVVQTSPASQLSEKRNNVLRSHHRTRSHIIIHRRRKSLWKFGYCKTPDRKAVRRVVETVSKLSAANPRKPETLSTATKNETKVVKSPVETKIEASAETKKVDDNNDNNNDSLDDSMVVDDVIQSIATAGEVSDKKATVNNINDNSCDNDVTGPLLMSSSSSRSNSPVVPKNDVISPQMTSCSVDLTKVDGGCAQLISPVVADVKIAGSGPSKVGDEDEANGGELSKDSATTEESLSKHKDSTSDSGVVCPESNDPSFQEISLNCSPEKEKVSVKPKERRQKMVVSIDEERLHSMLESLVRCTHGCTVEVLERLHCNLRRCIRKYRRELDKTSMLEDLESKITNFKAVGSLS